MVGIDLCGRKIGSAVGFAVEGFGPTQIGIDPAKLSPVFEEFDLQLWMRLLKGPQRPEAVGLSLVKKFQRVRRFIRLLPGGGGIDEVVLGFERDGRMPGARNELPGGDRAQDCQIDEHPGFPCFPSESAAEHIALQL